MVARAPIRKLSDAAIRDAAAMLRFGHLVAFPTETVYGLGADATNGEAVARIFEAKGRPRFNPLIVHVLRLDRAEALVRFDDVPLKLAKAFWPGPLTLVMPKAPGGRIADLVSAGLETLALRVPAHAAASALLAAADRPIAAPSANLSGHVSPTTAEHVAADLGDRVAMILDAGPATVGLESSIVGFEDGEPVLLRAGGVPVEALREVAGVPVRVAAHETDASPNAPGRLASHYAPRARLRLNADLPREGEAWLGFGPAGPEEDGVGRINLSPGSDLVEAAAKLFSALRTLDASGVEAIAVAVVPETGLGLAINDRLRRAAVR
ncbi:MAG: L-threonylcarbamoyladenylate synthase [Hyphomicrobiaceae bacterium]